MLGTRTAPTAGKRSLALAIAAGALTTGAALTTIAPAAQAATTQTPASAPAQAQAGARAADPCWFSGTFWWCKNRYGAPVYSRGDNPTVVGYMYTTTSWFKCRKEGARSNNGPHPYRWEWTQADNGQWGWMSDGDIYSETETLPGLPCPR
jgi:hypothetical protein